MISFSAFAAVPLPEMEELEFMFCGELTHEAMACQDAPLGEHLETVENLEEDVSRSVQAVSSVGDGSGDELFNEIIELQEELNDVVQLFDEYFFQPQGNRRPMTISKEAVQAYEKVNVSGPCSAEVIGNSVSQLLNAVMMDGKSEEFLEPWKLLLKQISTNRSTNRSDREMARQTLQSIEQFVKRHPSRSHEGQPVNEGPIPKDYTHVTTCFGQHMRGQGLELGEYSELALNALYMGNRRVSTDNDQAVIEACRGRSGREGALCLLSELNYSEPEKTLSVFDETGMPFLGYSKEDLAFFQQAWKSYPEYFGAKDKLFDVKAVLNGDEGGPSNHEYKDDQKVIIFAGPSTATNLVEENLAGFRDGMPRSCRRHWPKIVEEANRREVLDQEYTLIHEFAHSIEVRHMNLHFPERSEDAREWLNLGWNSGRPQGAPFQCEKMNEELPVLAADYAPPAGIPRDCWPFDKAADLLARHHGCVSFYGSTNATEDFAESIRFYITHPEILRESNPQKFAFIERLYKRLQE